jgi:uncharacterized protein (DUF1684 family)
VTDYLELLDWRRRMSDLFCELRMRPPDDETIAWFRATKDALFRDHPQSPVPPDRRAAFGGLAYWPWDRASRVLAQFVPAEDADAPLEQSTGGEMAFSKIGALEFRYHGRSLRLGAYWIQGYAGGLFVPFRDATSGKETYGGGRYLLDTAKSADFGSHYQRGQVALDFNYAYHPSCFYDPQWTCPLAPPENWLDVPIEVGERAGPPE